MLQYHLEITTSTKFIKSFPFFYHYYNLFSLLQFVMDKSDICQSSIASQQIIILKNIQQKKQLIKQKAIKYVTAHEIKTFQRLSEIKNYQFKQSYPTSFSLEFNNSQPYLHLVSQNEQDYILMGQQRQNASNLVQKNATKIFINMPLNNILRQNILKVQLTKFKRDKIFVIQNNQILDQVKRLRFKYTLNLLQSSFLFKVIIKIDENEKLWKQMEIPLIDNAINLEIHQFNNEQTDIKINNYLFHLLLKMPYSAFSFYEFFFENSPNIQKLQIISFTDSTNSVQNEGNCSKECLLI